MSSSYGNYNSAYPKPQPRVETEPSDKYQWTFPIQNREHLGKAIQSFPIVVVKAWAVWCQPCKIAGQKLDAFAETLSGYNKHILFMSENIDNEDSYFKDQVSVVPTFFVFFQGKIVKVHTGLEFDKLQESVYELLNTVVPAEPAEPMETPKTRLY